jgi:hypothetical protein
MLNKKYKLLLTELCIIAVMEKVFNAHERRGTIRAYQIGSMLRSLNPELAVDPEELKSQITTNDPDGVGNFDFDSFNRVALHFLLKQSRRESDGFISKHNIGLNDFPTL